MRLIDADELQKLFNETTTSLMDKIDLKSVEHLVRACIMVTQMIHDAPTIEAEPVKHGHWKEIAYKHFDPPDQPFSEEIDEDTGWTFEWDSKTVCSVCGYRTVTYTHYCPCCGAKMDKDELFGKTEQVDEQVEDNE